MRDAGGSVPGSGRSPGGRIAAHSSILAWRIPWTREPGGLQFMGSQRVGHDRSDLAPTARVRDVRDWWDGGGRQGRGCSQDPEGSLNQQWQSFEIGRWWEQQGLVVDWMCGGGGRELIRMTHGSVLGQLGGCHAVLRERTGSSGEWDNEFWDSRVGQPTWEKWSEDCGCVCRLRNLEASHRAKADGVEPCFNGNADFGDERGRGCLDLVYPFPAPHAVVHFTAMIRATHVGFLCNFYIVQ